VRCILLVFLDSNVFIYSQVERLPEFTIALSRLENARKEWQLGVNSVFVSESFYVLSRLLGQVEALKRLSLFLESDKTLYLPIEKATAVKAMGLAARRSGRRINDMILAQHALDSKADGLLTDNVKHFEGIPDLKIFGLR
jgi:predicted nucleic acid-binding protein